MDVAAISSLFNTVGLGGVFLWAAYYMLKRNEAQAAQQREEAIQRESRLVDALAAEQAYTRGTMTGVIERNTAALADMATTMEGFVCRDLRKEELKPLIETARRRAGES